MLQNHQVKCKTKCNLVFRSTAEENHSLLWRLLSTGHPPPGDFIALGSKSQGGEPKAPAVLLKPASTGLPADRKREASSALPSSSGLSSLTKRPKLSTTPPVSALGRLADVAAVDKRAISPSIKEPSVVPIEGKPVDLYLFKYLCCVFWKES